MVSLKSILTYKNENVVARYERDHPGNSLSGNEALTELLKYLYLSHKHLHALRENPETESLKFECAIHTEMKEIDDMWHTFLLFTKDYMDFCTQYFGQFMHHNPKTAETSQTPDEFQLGFERYLSYAYDHLGAKTLEKWFPEK
jgi:hypothetical protein